jgi:transcriptional regulator with XRE-family HTH domain
MEGQTLRNARIRLGWTQEEMAQQLGVSASHLAHCEQDEARITPRLERQVLILDQLGVACTAVNRLCALVGILREPIPRG